MTFARAFQWGENESAEQFAERIAPLVEAAVQKRAMPGEMPASDVSAGAAELEEI